MKMSIDLIVGIAVGLFIGVNIGIAIMSLMRASDDKEIEQKK